MLTFQNKNPLSWSSENELTILTQEIPAISLTHGYKYAPQIRNRKTFFEDETDGQIEGPRATYAQIVNGAVDGETANVTAGEEDGIDHVRISREGEACAFLAIADLEDSLIFKLFEQRVA